MLSDRLSSLEKRYKQLARRIIKTGLGMVKSDRVELKYTLTLNELLTNKKLNTRKKSH